jgi:hypothetical protein
MQLSAEQLRELCRENVEAWARLGEPSQEEITQKRISIEAMSNAEQKKLLRRWLPPNVDDLEERVENMQSRLSELNTIAMYGLGADQALTVNNTTTVAFSSLISGSSVLPLARLGLTLSNGVFTSTKENNILNVSYQLRFTGDSNSNGYRQGSISVGTEFFARNQSVTLAVATHVSGSSVIILDRGDSFTIKAFTTGLTSLVAAGNGTRLTIASF